MSSISSAQRDFALPQQMREVPRPFGKVMTAMVTPFTANREHVDFDAAQKLAAHLVDRGNTGLVINGTTGESSTTTEHEKRDLVRAVVEAVGDRADIIAGAGSNDTAHSVELALDAAQVGAHGVLVVTPYYNKPPQEGVYQHMLAVADSVDLPVMLYDIPGRVGVPIAKDTILRLAEHPRIVAIKDAKGDIQQSTEVMRETGLAYYSGDDVLNLPWLAVGGSGVVSVVAHVAAPYYAAMVDAVDASDLVTAMALHQCVAPVVSALMFGTQGAISSKAALELSGVLPHRAMRLPLPEATEAEVAYFRAQLSAVEGIL